MKIERAGALLFAVITSFVLTLVVSTIVIFTTNQYRIINSEIDRTRAFHRDQAGMEYAVYNLYNATAGWIPGTVGYMQNHNVNIGAPVNISVVNDPTGTSSYLINIRTNY